MIDCLLYFEGSCRLRRFGGNPKPIQCHRCRLREPLPAPTIGAVSGHVRRCFDVMLGGSWYWRRDCGNCEGRRRLVEELMDGEDETTGKARTHGAD